MGPQLLAETPLEALVLRHPPTAGGSLWTWLAVLAAALGLWRIRSATAAPKPKPKPTLCPSSHAAPAHVEPGRDLSQPKAARQQQQPPQPETRSESPAVDGGDVCFTPKGAVFKLRGCYVEEEDGGVEVGELPKEEYPWSGEGGVFTGECVDWRWSGDLGWYRYQDMAALNGRVVRLWEDEKRVAAAPLRRQVAW